VDHVHAALALDELAGQVQRRADAGRRVAQLARLLRQQRAECVRIGRRRPRAGHQHQGLRPDHAHCCQVLQPVVARLPGDQLVDPDLAGRSQQQRVAVGPRRRHLGRAQGAAGAGNVLHHDLLAQPARQLRRHRARDQVDAAAGGIAHHQRHRPGRVRGVLGEGVTRADCGQAGEKGGDERATRQGRHGEGSGRYGNSAAPPFFGPAAPGGLPFRPEELPDQARGTKASQTRCSAGVA
jgi:hypothetical protein